MIATIPDGGQRRGRGQLLLLHARRLGGRVVVAHRSPRGDPLPASIVIYNISWRETLGAAGVSSSVHYLYTTLVC